MNSDSNDGDAWLSADRLTLYFESDRAGQFDIYRATRGSPSDNFGEPLALSGPVNGSGNEGNPFLNLDELSIFFGRASAGGSDLFIATRPNRLAEFSEVVMLGNVNSEMNDDMGSLPSDGASLYFHSNRDGSGNDIYVARLSTAGDFELPVPVAELNTPTSDSDVAVTQDGLGVYFSSNRVVAGSKGGTDIFLARRSTVNDGFGAALLVEELNSDAEDWLAWISDDECLAVVVSGPVGDHDLYWAERER